MEIPKQVEQLGPDWPATGDMQKSIHVDSSAPLPSSSSCSSPSDSETDNLATRSQLFKRPPRFRSQRPRELLPDPDGVDEGDEPDRGTNNLLPFANASRADKGATSVGIVAHAASASRGGQDRRGPISGVDASSSVTSSASDAPKGTSMSPGPLSPTHRAELAKLSPRKAGVKSRKDGSEGTPSIGSSFSDIDGMR